MLPLFGDGTPHVGINHAFWMDRRWALREREAIGDASVGRTEGGERESGKRFWAPSTCTDTGRDGWGGKGRDPVEDF